MREVTVGIVAYRRPQALAGLLGRLERVPVAVVVANVGSDPAVTDVCARHPGAQELRVENRGYAAAVNALAQVAESELTVFTNDDVEFDPVAVDALVEIVRQGKADVAVPRVVRPDGEDEGTVLPLPTIGRLLLEWAVLPDTPPAGGRSYGIEKWRRPASIEPVEASTAVLVATRTQTLRSHPLPEEYFLYWEELEWFWTLRRAGVRSVVVPTVTVVHDGGRADVRPEKARLLARNAVRCVRRTQGRVSAVGAVAVVLLWNLRLLGTDVARLALAPGRARPGRVAARWAGLLGALTSVGELR